MTPIHGDQRVSHGYQPQTTYISKALYWTFFLGVFLGTVLGFSIRPLFYGDDNSPSGEQVATSTTVDEAESGAEESTPPPAESAAEVPEIVPAPRPPASPDSAPSEPLSSAPFDPDVKGLWPARHLFVGIEGTKASLDTLEWLNEFKPGGVLLGPENIADPMQLGALVLQIKQAVGLGTTIDDPPVIIYHDESRALPAIAATLEMATVGMERNPADAARAQARAARAHGIGVFLAPSLDIYLSGVSAPSLKRTVLGSQPREVSRVGLEYIRNLRSGGVLPVATHFPGAGLAVSRDGGVWHIPADQMDGMAAGMQPFQEAIAVNIPGLLVGHMAVPGIDRDAPNRPASSSPKLLKIFLRETLKFTGVVIADDLGSVPGIESEPLDKIAVTALVSGCDAVLLKEADRSKLFEICSALVRLAERRDFPAAQLESSKARLDIWQTLLAATPPPVEPAPDPEPVIVAVNSAAAKEADPPPVAPVDVPVVKANEIPDDEAVDTSVEKPEPGTSDSEADPIAIEPPADESDETPGNEGMDAWAEES
ncbi:MAG: hypothetical protein L3K26_13840 [Candidatus Hydrogenedentes bacterium]|nr:hypothetical protein [Candidatus Hydrogenedentota bacterium]